MSRGSPRVTVRIDETLLVEIRKEIELQNKHSSRSPEDLSLFIVRAIRERILHRRRSRAKRNAGQASSKVSWPDEIVSLAILPGSLWI